MTDVLLSPRSRDAASAASDRLIRPTRMARLLLLAVVVAAVASGFLATGVGETARAVADADMTRLLRAMAALKFVMALAAAGAVFWRLGSPAGPAWLAAYAVSCGAMFAGPGLIWGMAHLGMGALLLHGGLAATIILLWRDPVVGRRLEAAVARRRAALRAAGGSR